MKRIKHPNVVRLYEVSLLVFSITIICMCFVTWCTMLPNVPYKLLVISVKLVLLYILFCQKLAMSDFLVLFLNAFG
jgi:hypothetical protein